MKILLIVLASIGGVAVISEVGLRIIMGLGDPPLYVTDLEIGYLLAPEQKLRRQGSLYQTNQYSMRSQPLQSEAKNRILLLGDSVVNGSWWTDQTQTLSSLLEQKLEADNPAEVLNLSANSWGPRNELAYLKRFGLFDASTLVLIINTDDLFTTEPTSLAVGKSPSYPAKKPTLALIEYYQLFLASPPVIPELEQLKTATLQNDRLSQNLAAIKEIKAIADASQMKFILVLTPLLREFESDSTQSELTARKRLQELVAAEKIDYIDILAEWADFPQPEFLYRDRIHPTLQGNTKIIDVIVEHLAL
ncbi:MAG: SGNH/GDSL hydrolase family protein [Cyanobacteria bacterium J06600_6]